MTAQGQNPTTSFGTLCPHPPGADMIRRVIRWSSSATLLRADGQYRAGTDGQGQMVKGKSDV
jgi:hypothetical protein